MGRQIRRRRGATGAKTVETMTEQRLGGRRTSVAWRNDGQTQLHSRGHTHALALAQQLAPAQPAHQHVPRSS